MMKMALLVFGISLLATFPAHAQPFTSDKSGFENEALILQLGEDHRAAIEQRNLEGGLLSGAIKQFGIGNEASILLEGGSLSGSILQDGNDNAATLEVRDRNNRGAIEQYGDANSGGLQVAGEGKDVTLIQQGGVQNQGLPIKIGGDTPSGLPITIRQY